MISNDAALVVLAVGVTNMWAQTGMKPHLVAGLAGTLIIYDTLATVFTTTTGVSGGVDRFQMGEPTGMRGQPVLRVGQSVHQRVEGDAETTAEADTTLREYWRAQQLFDSARVVISRFTPHRHYCQYSFDYLT